MLVMEHAWGHHKERFDDLFSGGAYGKNILADVWKDVTTRRDPRIANHPMCTREGWAEGGYPHRDSRRRGAMRWGGELWNDELRLRLDSACVCARFVGARENVPLRHM